MIFSMYYNDIYELLNKGYIPKIIRHYKVIKRNNYNSNVTKIESNNNYSYEYDDYLSQDYDNYDNCYILDSISLKNPYKNINLMSECTHNRKTLNGTHYNNLNDLTEKLEELDNNAKQLYANELKFNALTDEEREQLSICVDKFNDSRADNLYIRLAPTKEMKIELLERIQQLINYNEENIFDVGIPIFNDNLAYSIVAYNQIKRILSLNLNIDIYWYAGYDNPLDDDFDALNLKLFTINYLGIDILYDWKTSDIEDQNKSFYIVIPSEYKNDIIPRWDGYIIDENGDKKYLSNNLAFDKMGIKTINHIDYVIYKSKNAGKYYGKIQ